MKTLLPPPWWTRLEDVRRTRRPRRPIKLNTPSPFKPKGVVRGHTNWRSSGGQVRRFSWCFPLGSIARVRWTSFGVDCTWSTSISEPVNIHCGHFTNAWLNIDMLYFTAELLLLCYIPRRAAAFICCWLSLIHLWSHFTSQLTTPINYSDCNL